MGGGHMMGNGSMMSGDSMGMGDDGDAIEWEDTMGTMNQQSNAQMMTWRLTDDMTGKSNMDVNDWKFKVGDKVKIQIFNDPKSVHPMQHPIHFHGQRFLVLSTNDVKNDNPVWQDTALIPKGDTMDILLEVSNPGIWMVHCHILEHAESGMMIPFRVE
jgi:FtsP/CotA-like multicopper oxidase with cupredoxin domain